MTRQRCGEERGATLIMLALATTALVAMAGLVMDGGRAYGERRQMQNAADAAAMAGTQKLNTYLTGGSTDARAIEQAVLDTAAHNGADRAEVTCRLVRFDRSVIGPCPTVAILDPLVAAIAAGVVVTTSSTEDTFLMAVVGQDTFTARAGATAQIGRPGGEYTAPFLVCATAPGHIPQLLLPDPSSSTGFSVNPAAIGATYDLYGNEIKYGGKDCGNDSASFRGNVCVDKNKCDAPSYSIPGDWDADTGNANGPTLRLVNSGSVCDPAFSVGCVVVLPLCPRGNGLTGAGFAMYCTDLGLFRIASIDANPNNGIDGEFLGPATVNQGGIVGPADPHGARIVALTD